MAAERINYDGRRFRVESNSESGEIDEQTTFLLEQNGNRFSGNYSGGPIESGHLLGLVRDDSTLEFHYHHINTKGEMAAGTCRSTPERRPDGRLVLQESWQWLTGDRSCGTSTLIEIVEPGGSSS